MIRTALAELIRSRLLARPAASHLTDVELANREEIRRLEIAKTDLDHLVSIDVREHQDQGETVLSDILRLLEQYRIEIVWDDGKPQLCSARGKRNGTLAWMLLIDDFDPDVLLCAHLYHWLGDGRHSAEVLLDLGLRKWKMHIGHADPDLNKLLARGVADMHVHFGGTRQPADAWRRFCNGTLQAEDLVPSGGVLRIRPPGCPANFVSDLEQARDLRYAHGYKPINKSPFVFLENERRWCLRLFHVLELERAQKVARAAEKSAPSTEVTSSAPGGITAEAAGHYLWVRHHAWRALRQPQAGSLPGLQEFSQIWFKAVKRDLAVRNKRARLINAVVREHRDPLQVLLAKPELRRLELRLSPLNTALAYHHFLRGWGHLEKALSRKQARLPAVAFAVHLQRNVRGGGSQPLAVFDQFDRDTAALQMFRTQYPLESRKFARIDLASTERDGPARLAAPFFRLLRGDTELLSRLAAQQIHGNHLPQWRELHAQKKAHAGLGSLRLGATCHSGEDFSVLLVGIKEVADAIDGMKLSVGDSIGHGLALGWDPEIFEQRSGGTAVVTHGELLDALIWLRLALERDCPAEVERLWLGRIDRWLEDRLTEIHGENATGVLRSHVALRHYRHGCLDYPFISAVPHRKNVAKLVEERFEDEAVRARFNKCTVWTLCQEQKLPAGVLRWAQRRLRERCAQRGIALELHPSSNIRITGMQTLSACPTMALLTAKESFPRAIGTDDPGVFATDIAMEYALVFEELQARGYTRREALALLDRHRIEGMETIHWPDASPARNFRPKRKNPNADQGRHAGTVE